MGVPQPIPEEAPAPRHKIVPAYRPPALYERQCRYFAAGFCRSGEKCPFKHGESQPQPTAEKTVQNTPVAQPLFSEPLALPKLQQNAVGVIKPTQAKPPIVQKPAAIHPTGINAQSKPPTNHPQAFNAVGRGIVPQRGIHHSIRGFRGRGRGRGRGMDSFGRGTQNFRGGMQHFRGRGGDNFRGRGHHNRGRGRGNGINQDEVKNMVAKMVEEMIAPLKKQAAFGRGEMQSGFGRGQGRGDFRGRGNFQGRGSIRGRGEFRGRGVFRGRGGRARGISRGRGRGRGQNFHNNQWNESYNEQNWHDGGNWDQGEWNNNEGYHEPNWKEGNSWNQQGPPNSGYHGPPQFQQQHAPPQRPSRPPKPPPQPKQVPPAVATTKIIVQKEIKTVKMDIDSDDDAVISKEPTIEDKVDAWRLGRGKGRKPTPQMLYEEVGISHLEARTMARNKFNWEPRIVEMEREEIEAWGKTLEAGTYVTPLMIWKELHVSWSSAKKLAARVFEWKKSEMDMSNDDITKWYYESTSVKTVTPIGLMMHLCMSLETSMLKAQELFGWQPEDGEEMEPAPKKATPKPEKKPTGTDMTDEQIVKWCREQPEGTRITPIFLQQKLSLESKSAKFIATTHFGWKDIDEASILAWGRQLRKPKLPTPKLVADQFKLSLGDALDVTKRLFSYSEHLESIFDYVNTLASGTRVTPFLLYVRNGTPLKIGKRFAQKYCGWDPNVPMEVDILKHCPTKTGFRCEGCDFEIDNLPKFVQHVKGLCLHKKFFNYQISPDPGCIAFTTGCWICKECGKMCDDFYEMHMHWQAKASCHRMKKSFEDEDGEFRYWKRKLKDDLHVWACPCGQEFPHFSALFKHFLGATCKKGPQLTYNETQLMMLNRWIRTKAQLVQEKQRILTPFPQHGQKRKQWEQHQGPPAKRMNHGRKHSGPILSNIPGPPGAQKLSEVSSKSLHRTPPRRFNNQNSRPEFRKPPEPPRANSNYHQGPRNANYVQPPEPPRPPGPPKAPVYQKPPEPPRYEQPPPPQYEQPPPPPQYEQPPPPSNNNFTPKKPPQPQYKQPQPPPPNNYPNKPPQPPPSNFPPQNAPQFNQPKTQRGTGYPPQPPPSRFPNNSHGGNNYQSKMPPQNFQQPRPPQNNSYNPQTPKRGTGYPPQNFNQPQYHEQHYQQPEEPPPSDSRMAFLQSDEAFYERMAMD